MAAKVLSNFVAQRVVKPFVYKAERSEVERFGVNCQSTILALKDACAEGQKGAVNLLRRGLISAGAQGPISNEKVYYNCNVCWNVCF